MSFTLVSSYAIVVRAGSGVNTNAATSAALLVHLADQAEGQIVAETRRDWVTNYTGLNQSIKNALACACSCHAANGLINYDMSGYSSPKEAETMLDVNRDLYTNAITVLKDFKSNTLHSP